MRVAFLIDMSACTVRLAHLQPVNARQRLGFAIQVVVKGRLPVGDAIARWEYIIV